MFGPRQMKSVAHDGREHLRRQIKSFIRRGRAKRPKINLKVSSNRENLKSIILVCDSFPLFG